MMKRVLLLLLLPLSVALSFGCPSPRNDNNANAANMKVMNANGVTNDNRDEGLVAPRDKDDKTVAVIVYYDKAKAIKILVVPDPIRVWRKNNHKLRFHAFNNLDVDIRGINFTFGTDPFDGTDKFDIRDIKAGDDDRGKTRRVKDDPTLDTKSFKYTITVTLANGEMVPPLDPQVEVVGASFQ